MRRDEIQFSGPLQGVRVLSSGVIVAGPLVAGLLSEFGADVIHVESPTSPDLLRHQRSSWSLQHRNQRCMTLDIPSEQGRKIFESLIAQTDIWVESSKAQTYDRWGLSDEHLWTINPALVIVHVSGFGQSGDPDVVRRPGFDPVAQAYSGFMTWNGSSDSPPLLAKPILADTFPAVMSAFAAVAAYVRAKATGQGESIDVAQYEVMVRMQGSFLMNFLNDGVLAPRVGNTNPKWAVSDTFECADGKWIMVTILGRTSWARAVTLFGLEGDPDFPSTLDMVPTSSVTGIRATERVAALCRENSAAAAERILADAGLASSRVFEPDDMLTEPHYAARETLTQWWDESLGEQVRGPNIIPKLRNNPPKIWRAGNRYSADTDDILDELGFDREQRDGLYASGVAVAPTPVDEGTP